MLLNLAAVAELGDPSAPLGGSIRRYAPDVSPSNHPRLDQLVRRAVRYFRDSREAAEDAPPRRRGGRWPPLRKLAEVLETFETEDRPATAEAIQEEGSHNVGRAEPRWTRTSRPRGRPRTPGKSIEWFKLRRSGAARRAARILFPPRRALRHQGNARSHGQGAQRLETGARALKPSSSSAPPGGRARPAGDGPKFIRCNYFLDKRVPRARAARPEALGLRGCFFSTPIFSLAGARPSESPAAPRTQRITQPRRFSLCTRSKGRWRKDDALCLQRGTRPRERVSSRLPLPAPPHPGDPGHLVHRSRPVSWHGSGREAPSTPSCVRLRSSFLITSPLASTTTYGLADARGRGDDKHLRRPGRGGASIPPVTSRAARFLSPPKSGKLPLLVPAGAAGGKALIAEGPARSRLRHAHQRNHRSEASPRARRDAGNPRASPCGAQDLGDGFGPRPAVAAFRARALGTC